MPHRVLVIEQEAARGHSGVTEALLGAALHCRRVDWHSLSVQDLTRGEEDLVVAVFSRDHPNIVPVFEWLRANPAIVSSLAILPVGIDEPMLQLVANAVDDFLFAPIRLAELRQRLARVLTGPRRELCEVRRRLQEEMGLTTLVGRDPVFVRAIEQIPRFARAGLPVLVSGETGTGKELCARALHHLGRRRQNPFIAVDCSALPDQLFENEFFGHVRGAFTDAHRDHRGLVALAEGGVLFLDEVDALSATAQAKLLRFLQERSYRALGSDRFERADLAVIAATNRDLEGCVRAKQFRSDLFFRLNVLHLHLPPLRERRSDIELLAYALLNECGDAVDSPPRGFSPAALRILTQHSWPGNVRELGNVVQRAAVACDGDLILPCHLALPGPKSDTPPTANGTFRAERAAALAAFERRYVEDLLRRHHGNVTHAAREAQQDRRAFGRFIKKYRIDRRALSA